MTKDQMIERVGQHLASCGYSLDTQLASATGREVLQEKLADRSYSEEDAVASATHLVRLLKWLGRPEGPPWPLDPL